MRTKTIRQAVVFPGAPREVYEIWMDSRRHGRLTGDQARITREAGGRFTTFGGWVAGRTLALVPGRKVVQSWWCADPCWPADHYSTITLHLTRHPRGTRLLFRHSGVPTDCVESIRQGWWDSYWTPLKEHFAAAVRPRVRKARS